MKYDLKDVAQVLPRGVSIKDALHELSKADPAIWVMYNRRLKGNPYNFDVSALIRELEAIPKGARKADYSKEMTRLLLRHRPFLIQPLCDPHPHKVYKKGRQVGVSELSVSEVLWFLWANQKTKWVYTFPREKQLMDFSTTRITETMDESPRMRNLFGVPNQTYTKRIGESSFLLLRSAWESGLGEGIDADGVTFDEKDRMKEGVEVAFKESLSSSSYGLLREVSTPTLPGKGVDVSYQKSCQYEWHVKCVKCGLEQTVSYPDNVIQMMDVPVTATQLPAGAYEYRCRKDRCRGHLDRINGRWIAKYPSRDHIAGYLIPQTICPWFDATNIMQKRIDYKYIQLWENYVLGETAVGESTLLTEQDFLGSMAGHKPFNTRTPDWDKVAVGVDWGHLNWVIVLGINSHNNRTYLLNIGVFEDSYKDELASVKQVDAFIAPFNPDMIVADAGYGKDRNLYLLRRYPGKMYACWYNPSEKGSRTFQPSWSDAFAKVLVDRTMTIKDTCRAIKEREIGLFEYNRLIETLIKHFGNIVPMRNEEDGEIYETIEKLGEDHLVHAMGYARLALEKLQDAVSGTFSFDFVG